MTIDERLDRLVERHEALSQTAELLAAEQRHAAAEHNREMGDLRKSQSRTEETLHRAIRLGVQEARTQRNRHRELEVLLKAFLERGGNGKY